MDATAPAPFVRIGPHGPRTPLVCSVPHAGRCYPPALLRDSAVPRAVLEQLEDRHADLLVAQAAATGAVAIVAGTARAWIDLNRAPDELDGGMGGAVLQGRAGARVRSGLGLIPRRLGGLELLRRLPDAAEARARLATVHAPYHRAVEAALAEAVRAHGFAVLIDCHSMPPLRGARPLRVVVGDRHGRSAGARVSAAALAAAGQRVGHNSPYAGAYTLDRHGRPAAHVHALQIEVDRSLYLEPDLREPSPGVAAAAEMVARIGRAAVTAARAPAAIAAE